MDAWEELQPKFRRAVLTEARERSKQAIAEQMHISRATLYRMIADECRPSTAVHHLAEVFVASHLRRSDTGPVEP